MIANLEIKERRIIPLGKKNNHLYRKVYQDLKFRINVQELEQNQQISTRKTFYFYFLMKKLKL